MVSDRIQRGSSVQGIDHQCARGEYTPKRLQLQDRRTARVIHLLHSGTPFLLHLSSPIGHPLDLADGRSMILSDPGCPVSGQQRGRSHASFRILSEEELLSPSWHPTRCSASLPCIRESPGSTFPDGPRAGCHGRRQPALKATCAPVFRCAAGTLPSRAPMWKGIQFSIAVIREVLYLAAVLLMGSRTGTAEHHRGARRESDRLGSGVARTGVPPVP